MIYSYYPGCTLSQRATALDQNARAAFASLGLEMEELPQWQCCGAVYPQASDEIATRLSAVRALMSARDLGRPLLTLCSACHHVIKRCNEDIKRDANFRDKVNAYLKPEKPYLGEARVVHYLEALRDDLGFDELKNHLDMSRLRTHADETTEGKAFCAFVSLIAALHMQRELGPLMEKRNLTKKRIVSELEKARVVTTASGKRLMNPLTRLQKDILAPFGVTEEDFKEFVATA